MFPDEETRVVLVLSKPHRSAVSLGSSVAASTPGAGMEKSFCVMCGAAVPPSVAGVVRHLCREHEWSAGAYRGIQLAAVPPGRIEPLQQVAYHLSMPARVLRELLQWTRRRALPGSNPVSWEDHFEQCVAWMARKSPVMSDTTGPSGEVSPMVEFDCFSSYFLYARFADQRKRHAKIRKQLWSASTWDVWRNVRRSWEKDADDAALSEPHEDLADWMSCRSDDSSHDSVDLVGWDHFAPYAPAASSTGHETWQQTWSSRWKWTPDAEWSGRTDTGHGSSYWRWGAAEALQSSSPPEDTAASTAAPSGSPAMAVAPVEDGAADSAALTPDEPMPQSPQPQGHTFTAADFDVTSTFERQPDLRFLGRKPLADFTPGSPQWLHWQNREARPQWVVRDSGCFKWNHREVHVIKHAHRSEGPNHVELIVSRSKCWRSFCARFPNLRLGSNRDHYLQGLGHYAGWQSQRPSLREQVTGIQIVSVCRPHPLLRGCPEIGVLFYVSLRNGMPHNFCAAEGCEKGYHGSSMYCVHRAVHSRSLHPGPGQHKRGPHCTHGVFLLHREALPLVSGVIPSLFGDRRRTLVFHSCLSLERPAPRLDDPARRDSTSHSLPRPENDVPREA